MFRLPGNPAPNASTPGDSGSAYDRHRKRALERQKRLSAVGRDIGDMPPIADPARRAQAEASLAFFCKTYFPESFKLAFSADHHKAIRKLEIVARDGGLFAFAMPRGSGKTTLVEAAACWAALFGFRRYVMVIGASEPAALQILESIKRELETNDLLLADFPEACYPIRKLEGMTLRARGQTYRGIRTHISFRKKDLALPTIAGSRSSGCIVGVAGITGSVRGRKFKRIDGTAVRPDFAILDDPQTDQSARSPAQTNQRERTIRGTVLGLSGPGVKIAAAMPCTVIECDDLAERMLDRQRNPQWQGEKSKLVYAWPNGPQSEELWQQYRETREAGQRNGLGTQAATDFYAEHRAAMDAGSKVAWAERFNADEISALQYAYNLRFDLGEAAFGAEYQNEPPKEAARAAELTSDQIANRFTNRKRGVLPLKTEWVTAFIDVQQTLLYYVVAAWESNFTGYVVDYGAFPGQKTPYFTLPTAKRTLAAHFKEISGLEALLYAGLTSLVQQLCGNDWTREDGHAFRPGKVLIDANWGLSTSTVYKFCRESNFAGSLVPSHGKFFGPESMSIDQFKAKAGEKIGDHWLLKATQNQRGLRHAIIDTNHWKTFVHARLAEPKGGPGALTLFGDRAFDHQMLGDQLTSEFRERKAGKGREIDVWKLKPTQTENHLFDCVVGAAVGASILGASINGKTQPKAGSKPKREFIF